MAILCPKTITLPDGAQCELFERFTDSSFGGLLKTDICSYKCNDGTYFSRWRYRFLCCRSETHEHRFRPNGYEAV